MTIKVEGSWDKGLAFDVHTLSSTYLGPDEYGHDQWDNTRSEMGQLIYRLKYKLDNSTLSQIVALLEKIKGIEKFDSFRSRRQTAAGGFSRSRKLRSPWGSATT